MWFGVVYMWIGANIAGQHNKNAFKFVLQLLILSQTQILERSGLVVECLTRDRRAAGLSLTGITALWSLSTTHLS